MFCSKIEHKFESRMVNIEILASALFFSCAIRHVGILRASQSNKASLPPVKCASRSEFDWDKNRSSKTWTIPESGCGYRIK